MIPLFVDLENEWRGGQSQALLLLLGLYERGHAAELVTAKGSPLGHRARKVGIDVHEVSRGMLRLPAAAMIRSMLQDGRIELVHANEAHALTAAWLAGAQRRVPLLCSRRIGFPLQQNWISKARFRALERFVANSKDVAQSLVDSGFAADRISIVNEGVEIPTLITAAERKAARNRWGIADDEFLFGCASAFAAEKGQRHVVAALDSARKIFPRARLLLAGEGKCRVEVMELAKQLQLEDAVLLPGFLKNMQEFYAALDAFVFPSEFEGLGTALQAAMSFGLPCISTSRGALKEVVDHERTALVVEPNGGEFAAAMGRLIGDEALRKRLGDAGRREVQERFSADRMVENTLQVYEEVLQGKGRIT